MQITTRTWNNYIARLSRLNEAAGQKMREYIRLHGTENTEQLISYAYAVITRYGEGSAELACQMYDALAKAEGMLLPAAEPAATASYGEVARMVHATKDQNPENLPSGVSRLVKRAGADTTLHNAVRDGAQWAWVPHGDTCPFCITLASRGWQTASQKLLKNGHAEHIHSNCDCEFAVRFHSGTSVAGYDPEKYLRQYRAAGSDVNAMRRIDYAARKDAINAQKRAAYAARKAETTLHSQRGSGGSSGQNGETVHRFLGKVDLNDAQQVEALKDSFCSNYASSKVENMMVITKDGEVHFMTDNNPKGVDCSYLGDKLKGSYNIHTHPPDTTQYSFSTDADIPAAFSDGTAIMEAVDYKYRYQFVVPSGITLEQWEAVCEAVQEERNSIMTARGYDFGSYEENIQHVIIDETCRRLGVKCYRREVRK
mgnify:FL=1